MPKRKNKTQKKDKTLIGFDNIPKTDKTILGNIPRFKTLIINGIFDFGLYEYDSNLIFLSFQQ